MATPLSEMEGLASLEVPCVTLLTIQLSIDRTGCRVEPFHTQIIFSTNESNKLKSESISFWRGVFSKNRILATSIRVFQKGIKFCEIAVVKWQ